MDGWDGCWRDDREAHCQSAIASAKERKHPEENPYANPEELENMKPYENQEEREGTHVLSERSMIVSMPREFG